jgi:hypothetical protein
MLGRTQPKAIGLLVQSLSYIGMACQSPGLRSPDWTETGWKTVLCVCVCVCLFTKSVVWKLSVNVLLTEILIIGKMSLFATNEMSLDLSFK